MRTNARSWGLLGLLILLGAAACDGGPEEQAPPLTAEDVELRIVGGDGQTAPVASVASAQLGLMAAVAERELLPEPLVVELVDTASGQPVASIVVTSSGGGLLEPQVSYAGSVPDNLLVRFRVVEEGCGEAFIGTALPDSGEVVDRWVKGTKAGACHMEVARLIDGQPHTDTTFLWNAEPGPPDYIQLAPVADPLAPGDTLDVLELFTSERNLRVGAWDAYNNPITDLEGHSYAWAVTSRMNGAGGVRPTEPMGQGNLAVIPNPAEMGWEADGLGDYPVWVWVWMDGVLATEAAPGTVAGS